MKFNILDYNQRIAISMGLDLKDLHILGWIQDFWPEMNKKIIDGEEYGWIQYDYLNKDLPILWIKTANGLYKRLQTLVDVGLLKHKGVKDSKGSFSYYKITEKIVELLREKSSRGGSDENHDGGSDGSIDGNDRKQDRVVTKGKTKYPSTKNSSTISFLSLPPEEKEKKVNEIFDRLKLKSDRKKYFLFRESKNWKGVANLEADILWWEDGHKEKFPELHVEKQIARIAPTESEEIQALRKEIKALISRSGEMQDYEFFIGRPIEKTPSGFIIKVEDERALKYGEVLRKINMEIKCQK